MLTSDFAPEVVESGRCSCAGVVLVYAQEDVPAAQKVDQLLHRFAPSSADKPFVNDIGRDEDILVVRVRRSFIFRPTSKGICSR